MKKGIEEGVPYSLSRWTDVPSAKWGWFKVALAAGEMFAFDPRTAIPSVWSLKPQDTLGLNFWTKDPRNLLLDRQLLQPYRVKIHMTLTGWEEVEKGAPTLREGCNLLTRTTQVYGAENVTWRFSPVPLVDDVVDRFGRICVKACRAGVREVYLAFLQENDLMPEPRSPAEREALLKRLGERADVFGIKVFLCNDDHQLLRGGLIHHNVSLGVCARPNDWGGLPPVDGCGCATMVDPFTFNESCNFGCTYCYSADKSLSPKKHNTSRSLPVVP
jgi:sulfatase maturation enzyme AslB (radical SAM superfamily)